MLHMHGKLPQFDMPSLALVKSCGIWKFLMIKFMPDFMHILPNRL